MHLLVTFKKWTRFTGLLMGLGAVVIACSDGGGANDSSDSGGWVVDSGIHTVDSGQPGQTGVDSDRWGGTDTGNAVLVDTGSDVNVDTRGDTGNGTIDTGNGTIDTGNGTIDTGNGTIDTGVGDLPSVSFASPAAGKLAGDTISYVKVNASDADGIANVKLYVDGEFVRQENVTPYEWNSTKDSKLVGLSAGNHTLKAVATDAVGDQAEATIVVTVAAPLDTDTGVDTGVDTGIDTGVDTGVAGDTDPGTLYADDPSILPTPSKGMRWVIQTAYSDEFNGNALNKSKWHDYFAAGWKGRAPAKFVPYAVSVGSGKLKIKNGILDTPDGSYKYYGGAVTSVGEDAHFGYYEAKMIASRTKMSSTFWMSNRKADFAPGTCSNDRYSQELDIQESIGSAGSKGASMQTNMSSNTHFRYIPCNASKETFYTKTPPKTPLNPDVSSAYHIYGAWWRDDKHVTFYADNQEGPTQYFSTQISNTPFDRPMFLCMVTETYDWTTPVEEWELLDDSRNATYYEWVRSWKLVPIDQDLAPWNYEIPVLVEQVAVSNAPSVIGQGNLVFDYEFEANMDRTIVVVITDGAGTVMSSSTLAAREGKGYGEATVPVGFSPKSGVAYTVSVRLQKNSDMGTAPIDQVTFSVKGN